MKKHTRFLALLLTAIMRLSLAACGGNSDTPPSGGDTPQYRYQYAQRDLVPRLSLIHI